MALSELDRTLLQRCLAQEPRAWQDFVDRFMGLVVHVMNHAAQCRSLQLSVEDRDDLLAEVFFTIVRDDYAALRHFRGDSSLATYLTVIARRVIVRQLVERRESASLGEVAEAASSQPAVDQLMSNREEVARLLDELEGTEAEVVRMYHLEGKSYQEISSAMEMPENSVGPTLSRARDRLRRAADQQAAP